MVQPYLAKNIKFCPRCAAEFKQVGASSQCFNCDFVYYLNPAPCVTLLICRDKQVLLAKRAIEPKKGYWDLVGGFIELNETAEEAAVREAKEETNLEVKVTKYLTALPDIYGETFMPTLCLVFQMEIVSGELRPQDDVAELKWFDLDSLPEELAFDHLRPALNMLRDNKYN